MGGTQAEKVKSRGEETAIIAEAAWTEVLAYLLQQVIMCRGYATLKTPLCSRGGLMHNV